MFYAKLTKQEKQTKLKKLNFLKTKLESQIKKWAPYLKMSLEEKQKCRDIWDRYYENVRNTPLYDIFVAEREALREGKAGLVKELSFQVRDMKEKGEIPKIALPKVLNPYEFDNDPNISAYEQVKRAIESLEEATGVDNNIFED